MQACKAVLNALQDERTLKSRVQGYSRQEQQKNPVNLVNTIPARTFGNNGATFEFNAKIAPESIYSSFSPSRDYASDIEPRATHNLETMSSHPISQNVSQFNSASGNFISKI